MLYKLCLVFVELWCGVLLFYMLDFSAVDWNCMLVRLIVDFSEIVGEANERVFAVLRNREMHLVFVVVPVEGHAAVSCTFPV